MSLDAVFPLACGDSLSALAVVTAVMTVVVMVRLRRVRRSTSPMGAVYTVIRPAEREEEVIRGPGAEVIAMGGSGRNRKLAHLKAALPIEGVAIVADADVYVDQALIDGLLAERADVVFAPPAPDPGGSRAGRAVLLHTLHNFRALFALDATSICGKALALSPAAQQVVLQMDDCIAEDLRLAESVRSVAIAKVYARTKPTAGLQRFTRWFQALKAHKPLAFASVPLFIAPLPLLVFASPLAFLAAFLARALLAYHLDRRGWYWFWLGEPLLLLAWCHALVRREVKWRDNVFVLGARGRIV